jgi:hypothetical protein
METCLTAAVGGSKDLVAFPSKILYQIQDVKPYNQDVDVHPIAVTYPKTADQVSEIVKCATTTAGFTVQPRGGGHSYANYGKSNPRAEYRQILQCVTGGSSKFYIQIRSLVDLAKSVYMEPSSFYADIKFSPWWR